jgi:hypothetical protein
MEKYIFLVVNINEMRHNENILQTTIINSAYPIGGPYDKNQHVMILDLDLVQ